MTLVKRIQIIILH